MEETVPAPASNRRQILIVNSAAQKRIVLAITLFPSIALASSTMVVAVFCRRLLGEAARAEVELPSLMPLFVAMLAFVVASGVVILVQALRFSHRVAGPSYRLMKSLERVRAGDIGFRVKLRMGDHLGEVADEMNRLLEWLNQNPPAAITRNDAEAAKESAGVVAAALEDRTPAASTR